MSMKLPICALLIVALAGHASVAEGRMLQQSTSAEVEWVVPDSGTLDNVTIPVGGEVTFTWSMQHNLYEVYSYACPSSYTGTNAALIGSTSASGEETVEFPEAGIRYFACQVSTHCREGQLIAVIVGGGSPAPAPAPETESE